MPRKSLFIRSRPDGGDAIITLLPACQRRTAAGRSSGLANGDHPGVTLCFHSASSVWHCQHPASFASARPLRKIGAGAAETRTKRVRLGDNQRGARHRRWFAHRRARVPPSCKSESSSIKNLAEDRRPGSIPAWAAGTSVSVAVRCSARAPDLWPQVRHLQAWSAIGWQTTA